MRAPFRACACAALAALFVSAGCGASEPPSFSADSVVVHVARQVAFGPRVPGSPARDACARYLARTLEATGARVSLQDFEVAEPYAPAGDARRIRLINIVASFAPERTKRLLLAAHYDSRPWADEEPDSAAWSTPIPGAVDGAASAGILLELARILGAHAPGELGVDIVLFDGEDYGKPGDPAHYLLGSKHFAATLGGYRPARAIVIDMVGGVGTRVRREGYSREHAREWLDRVFARAAALNLDYFEAVDAHPVYDDHVPLLQAGIPAIDLFGYDYGAWHTLGDDVDQCDPALLYQVGTLLRSVIYDPPW